MDLHQKRLTVRVLSASIAGAVAGLAMAVFLCGDYWLNGAAAGYPLKLFAATLLGDAALLPSSGMGYELAGLGVHLALSAFLGALFGGITQTRRLAPLLLSALVFSAAVALAMRYVLLPSGMNFALLARMPTEMYLSAHLVFGLALGTLVRPTERRFERPARDRPPSIVPLYPPLREELPPLRRVA